jgi:hypothetical protein
MIMRGLQKGDRASWMREELLLMLVLAGLFCACGNGASESGAFQALPFEVQFHEEPSLLKVNGAEVTAEELDLIAVKHRGAVIDYYRRNLGASLDTFSWNASYHGKVPAESLLRRTLLDAVRIKVQQVLAQEYGVRGEVGFDSLERRWSAENAERREAAEQGKVLYGPVEYGLREYYEQDLKSLDLALMQMLEEKGVLKAYEQGKWRGRTGSRRERIERAYHAFITEQTESAEVLANGKALMALDLAGAARETDVPVSPETSE